MVVLVPGNPVPRAARSTAAVRVFALAAAALLCLLSWKPVLGQVNDSPVTFDIPAQLLSSALNSWAVQAGSQVFFEQTPVAGKTSPPVSGSMPAKQALSALLAHSNLEFAQNADGAFLVRRTARAKAVPVARHLESTSVAQALATADSGPRSARDAEGPWEWRLRGDYVDPRNSSDALNLPSIPASVVPQDGTRTDGAWSAELGLEYYFSSHWSSELALNWPHKHDLTLRNSNYANGLAGDFKLMPNFLTFKYNLNPDGTFRPYVGAGVNVTSIYDVNAGPFSLSKTLAGPAAQAGFDLRLGEHWMLNADVKWARLRPAVAFNDTLVGRMNVDPLIYGIGIGYRFGGSPAPAPVAAPAPAAVIAPPPPPDSDGDGVPDSRDKCPNTPAGVQVDADGCPLDSDHDGVPDYLDKCPGTPPHLKVDGDGCEIEEMVLRGVNFKTNSAELTPDSAETLDGVVAVLKQRLDTKAEIHGYTDARGPDAYNVKLSERRAASVVEYLVIHGIARDTLSAKGFGKANPLASNDTADGRAQNRRVTVAFARPVRR